MMHNMGGLDRVLRIVIGLALIGQHGENLFQARNPRDILRCTCLGNHSGERRTLRCEGS